ncbi:MAG: hypothetical protein D6732_13795 [Methanobacteriota archaeon]|nr:MAG: hypothetical protein D6732_13795 [Euryarchaeota archaeon]
MRFSACEVISSVPFKEAHLLSLITHTRKIVILHPTVTNPLFGKEMAGIPVGSFWNSGMGKVRRG